MSVLLFSCHQGQQRFLSVFEGAPRINDPAVTGNYPNTPFLFAVPTSGERPVTWSASGLPAGLHMDSSTGFITGMVKQKGSYQVAVTAENRLGKATRQLLINIGDTLALTPPMGWNSWNTFRNKISDSLVRGIADSMVSSGMRDLGYQYVDIDDLWQLVERDKEGNIQIDSTKFPHGIRAVADYVHSKGLKLGIYSDASDRTCGGVAGSYGFEEKDALAFASWGVDLLKYDYCGAPRVKDTAIVRYRRMGEALRNTDRSIVFSVCEWGAFDSEPWTWAAGIGGNYWRTTWDIRNTWKLNYDVSHTGIMDILDINAPLDAYAGPGHWNDPDMLVVGINDKKQTVVNVSGKNGRPLTEEEQQSHMSLWCLMAAPLLCGNDIRDMDSATRRILLNPEIIALDQDPLGRQAKVVHRDSLGQVFVKPLAGGDLAVGLLNRSDSARTLKISWQALGISGSWKVRDLWEHKNLGPESAAFAAMVPVHGCTVIRLSRQD
jgi:alpha-galactosidase